MAQISTPTRFLADLESRVIASPNDRAALEAIASEVNERTDINTTAVFLKLQDVAIDAGSSAVAAMSIFVVPSEPVIQASPTSTHWLDGAPMNPAAVATEPLPAIAGFPFLHRGACAVIVGETGGGRSSIIQSGFYDSARAGLRCAYLGSEVTQSEFDARSRDIASRRQDSIDDALLGQLALVRYFNLSSVVSQAWEASSAWIDGIVSRFDILAIDPLSAVASALDLDFDNSNRDYVRFYDRLIQPLTDRGLAVVLIENVGHDLSGKRRAKGASAKGDKADLTFSCSRSTNPVGLIVKAQKVRSIRAGFQRGDEWLIARDSQRIQHIAQHGGADAIEFRPTHIMQEVSELIEHEQGLGVADIRMKVPRRSTHIDTAINLLTTEGYIEVKSEKRRRSHFSLRPYRGDAEPDPNMSQLVRGCPDVVPDIVGSLNVPSVPSMSEVVPDTLPNLSQCPDPTGSDRDIMASTIGK